MISKQTTLTLLSWWQLETNSSSTHPLSESYWNDLIYKYVYNHIEFLAFLFSYRAMIVEAFSIYLRANSNTMCPDFSASISNSTRTSPMYFCSARSWSCICTSCWGNYKLFLSSSKNSINYTILFAFPISCRYFKLPACCSCISREWTSYLILSMSLSRFAPTSIQSSSRRSNDY